MSLEDKFQAYFGDLVLFTSEKENRADLVGYVRAYSDKKVQLTNKAPYLADGNKRSLSWIEQTVGEKRYSTNLSMWNTYNILKEAKKE